MSSMYYIRPVHEANAKINLPTCMYSMPYLYDDRSNGQVTEESGGKDGDKATVEELEDLLSKQMLLLNRIEVIEKKLEKMGKQMPRQASNVDGRGQGDRVKGNNDICIHCHYKRVPHGLLLLARHLEKEFGLVILTKTHISSTLKDGEFKKDTLEKQLQKYEKSQIERVTLLGSDVDCDLRLTFIYSDTNGHESWAGSSAGLEPAMMADVVTETKLIGEGRIMRYLCTVIESRFANQSCWFLQSETVLDELQAHLIKDNRKDIMTLGGSLTKSSDELSLEAMLFYSFLINANENVHMAFVDKVTKVLVLKQTDL